MAGELILISVVALVVSGLTLFSGFGLGTLLLPAFALFFPLPVAVAATAVVHLANNLFKAWLMWRHANWRAVWLFGLPACAAAFGGAGLLLWFSGFDAVAHWQLGDREMAITPLKLIIGPLIVFFALFDLVPRLKNLTFDMKYLPYGGLLSGFLGGLSGHQGAMRSAFLIKSGLSRDAFIGTGVMAAVMVDIARLIVYGASFYQARFSEVMGGSGIHVAAASVAAFVGAYFGKRLLGKITLDTVQWIVGIMLILSGLAMTTGLI